MNYPVYLSGRLAAYFDVSPATPVLAGEEGLGWLPLPLLFFQHAAMMMYCLVLTFETTIYLWPTSFFHDGRLNVTAQRHNQRLANRMFCSPIVLHLLTVSTNEKPRLPKTY